MPTAHLHVGMEKTGSTSIQHALVKHADWLTELGYHVPKAATPGRSAKHDVEWKDPHDRAWIDLAREIDDVRAEHVILSEETIYCLKPPVLQRIRKMFPDHDFSVILYVREQADFIQALALQSQKKPRGAFNLRNEARVQKFIDSRKLQFNELAESLESVFGRGSLCARMFDRSCFVDGDLFSDFVAALGIENSAGVTAPIHINPTIGPEFADILRARRAELTAVMAYDEGLNLAGRLTTNGVGSRYFLSEERVSELRQTYRRPNKEFARRFLRNADEIPEKVVWETVEPAFGRLDELGDLLLELGGRYPMLVRHWKGDREIGSRMFPSDEWEWSSSSNFLMTRPAKERATLRFRLPYGRSLRGDCEGLSIAIRTEDSSPAAARVSANGGSEAMIAFPEETVFVPVDSCEPYDQVEITVEPVSPGDFPFFTGLSITDVNDQSAP